MISKLGALWPVRRLVALAVGFWDAFLRDNKVLPPVLAVAALFVFAWIVVGSFIGAPDDETVSSQGEVAQSDGGAQSQPSAPEIESPNTDSYAAYQSKDPFRQLFETAESTIVQEDTTFEDETGDFDSTSDDFEDTTGDGSQFPDDSTSQPGAAEDQYETTQPPREDPTAPQTPAPQTPAPQTPAPQAPAPQPGNLFDSGGDLQDPNRR